MRSARRKPSATGKLRQRAGFESGSEDVVVHGADRPRSSHQVREAEAGGFREVGRRNTPAIAAARENPLLLYGLALPAHQSGCRDVASRGIESSADQVRNV